MKRTKPTKVNAWSSIAAAGLAFGMDWPLAGVPHALALAAIIGFVTYSFERCKHDT